MMKKEITLAFIALLGGCAHPPDAFVIKNLDGWQRFTEDYHPTVQIEVDAEGYPSASKEVIDAFRAQRVLGNHYQARMQENPDDLPQSLSDAERTAILAEHGIEATAEIQRIRWQIHPEAPLERVSLLTDELTGTERSELWTSHGIFIVGAPNYGGRRLPWFGTDVEYRVKGIVITKNGSAWRTVDSNKDAVSSILADLSSQTNLGFVNLYFEFLPSSTWSDVESVISTILPKLDRMRGLWLGVQNEGTVTLHLHDVWRKEWKSTKKQDKKLLGPESDAVEFDI